METKVFCVFDEDKQLRFHHIEIQAESKDIVENDKTLKELRKAIEEYEIYGK